MAKKTCSKGHIYDLAVYGDNCPFCPSGSTVLNNNFGAGNIGNMSKETEVIQEAGGRTHVIGNNMPTVPIGGNNIPTVPLGDNHGGGVVGGTIIRPADGSTRMETSSGKRIVGLLVTYNTTPTGQVFNIYEGKNSVGRNASNNIALTGDLQVSGEHLMIAYYPVTGKFYFEAIGLTQNGTFHNDKFYPKGGDELVTFDVLRIGSTKLIFIAIPQIQ